MNIKKKLAAFMAAACVTNICFWGGVTLSVNAEDGNSTPDTAIEVVYDTTYEASVSSDDYDYYKLVLPESGHVSIEILANLRILDYRLVNAEDIATVLNSGDLRLDPNLNLNYNVLEYDLTGGTYYFITKFHSTSEEDFGDYTVKATYEACGESFAETGNGNNNNVLEANPIEFGTEYKGQIALNDTLEYYSFTLDEAKKFSWNIVSNLDDIHFNLYDMDGERHLDSRINSSDPVANAEVTLEAGEYYIKVNQCSGCTGNYTITTNIASLYEKGDVNRDGTINLYDVIEVAKYIMSMTTLDEEQLTIGDMNSDTIVNLYDAIEIAKIIMNG